MNLLGMDIYIVSAEDLLISKIIWIQHLQNSVQREDIKLPAKAKNLDWNYINEWIKELKLKTFNLFSE